MIEPSSERSAIERISTAFARESDRAAAIVAGAMLDDALASLLKARLVEPAKGDESLVGRDGSPLGTFSARILAAYQLGLISKYLARDLDLVRKVRNAFAHDALDLTFDSSSVRDRIGALNSSGFLPRFKEVRDDLGPPGPRGDFLGHVSLMLFTLHVRLKSIERLPAHPPEFSYFDFDSAIEISDTEDREPEE